MSNYATRHDEAGASSAEYAILVSLIAIFIISAVLFFGGRVNGLFTESCGSLPPATSTPSGC